MKMKKMKKQNSDIEILIKLWILQKKTLVEKIAQSKLIKINPILQINFMKETQLLIWETETNLNKILLTINHKALKTMLRRSFTKIHHSRDQDQIPKMEAPIYYKIYINNHLKKKLIVKKMKSWILSSVN